jgi:superoxide dismutase, Cu-Zn family
MNRIRRWPRQRGGGNLPLEDQEGNQMHRTARRLIGVTAAMATAALMLAVTMSPPASAAKPLARATLRTADGTAVGEVVFKGHKKHADRVTVSIDAPNAPNLDDFHGLHVHTTGTCTAPGFTSAGGHWNPTSSPHGQHVGDLPSVLLGSAGSAEMEFVVPRFHVGELFDADGSAVVLHVGRDNFANIPADPYGGPVGGTLATGDAGGRYACGVVGA